jgi:hypothetical protein
MIKRLREVGHPSGINDKKDLTSTMDGLLQ